MMSSNKEMIDISLPLDEKTPVYPGNPSFSAKGIKTPTTFLSELTLGTHAGTHIDAPRHIDKNAASVDALDPALFVGMCRVLDMTHVAESVMPEDIEPHAVQKGERILLKTRNSERGFYAFYEDYVYMHGDTADMLAHIGVALVGIDALSIKQRGGEDVRPHTSLLGAGIPIVEGLNLAEAEAGAYTFVGLPLRLMELDGSPIRAILIPEEGL